MLLGGRGAISGQKLKARRIWFLRDLNILLRFLRNSMKSCRKKIKQAVDVVTEHPFSFWTLNLLDYPFFTLTIHLLLFFVHIPAICAIKPNDMQILILKEGESHTFIFILRKQSDF